MLLFRSIFWLAVLSICATHSVLSQPDSVIVDSANITFKFNVDEALLILNNQFDEARFVKNDEKITTKAGLTSVKLSIIHDYLFEEQFELNPDTNIVVTHNFQHLPLTQKVLDYNYAARKILGYNLIVITDDESFISINADSIGTGFTALNVETQETDLTLENQNHEMSLYYDNFSKINTSSYSLRVIQRYMTPDKRQSKLLSVIPGYSQAYKYEFNKAIAIRLGLGVSLVGLTTFQVLYKNEKKDFDNNFLRYTNSTVESEVTELGNTLDDQKTTLDSFAKIRNISMISALTIYAYNLIDGIFHYPKNGYRKTKPIEFYLDSNLDTNFDLTMRVNL